MLSIKYLDDTKKKLGVSSDYALAKQTGISQEAISQYRNGKRVMDDYTAAKLAEVLEIDPLEVIATANADREKDENRANFWRVLAKKRAAPIAAILLLVGVAGITYEHIDAQHTIHYAQLLGLVGVIFLFWSWKRATKAPH